MGSPPSMAPTFTLGMMTPPGKVYCRSSWYRAPQRSMACSTGSMFMMAFSLETPLASRRVNGV